MVLKRLLPLSLLFITIAFGQSLPDREELVEKLLKPETADQACQDLLTHFQLGGVRTLIRNLNGLPKEKRLQFIDMISNLDLFRFRNDLNANLQEAPDAESKASYLKLLATFGDKLENTLFEPYAKSETEEMIVRLAAASGLVQIQSRTYYDLFHEISENAEIDPATGRNDFSYALLSKDNLGFYAYTAGKLDGSRVPHGILISAIAIADNDARGIGIFEFISENKRLRKYLPLLIDRAVQVGGVQLLEAMAQSKRTKHLSSQIDAAKEAAAKIAQYRGKLMNTSDKNAYPFGAVLPRGLSANGLEEFRSAFGIARVSESGDISLVVYETPFGQSSDNMKELFTGKTFPALLNWKPQESFYFVHAPR